MTIGNREFTGKDARANAGDALNQVAYSWRNDQSVQVRGHFKGFEIITQGHALLDGAPDLFIRGKEVYGAKINLENPLGTIASIEHVLRSLDRYAETKEREVLRSEKALADYTTQLNRPFEHAERLKKLVTKQAELNAMLDLDKSDAQAVADKPDQPKEVPQSAPVPFDDHRLATAAVAALRTPTQTLSSVLGKASVRASHREPA